MNLVIVGVADYRVATGDDILVTYALGSCVAVIIHDPLARIGGLLHFVLPESAMDGKKALANPALFADTGIPRLFRDALALGADKRRLVVRLAGGASVMDDSAAFQIGKRNQLAARRMLWRAGILLHGEDVGGSFSRTVRLEVATGRVVCRLGNGMVSEIVAQPGRAGMPGMPGMPGRFPE